MDIVIYTTPGCYYCEQIKELCRRADIEYTQYVVRKDISREDFVKKFPDVDTYPHVVIDGVDIGGLTDTAKYFVENKIINV
jgi:glutaredoxin 3